MKRIAAAAIAASLVFACTGALAMASATVTIDGNTAGMNGSGATWAGTTYQADLGPGQSESFDLAYTATVRDDGLPASRDWTFCTPLLFSYCGPDPTGSELAEAYITVGMDTRSQPQAQFFDVSGLQDLFFDAPAGGGTKTYTGDVAVTITNISEFFEGSLSFYALDAVFVDASPAPEPSNVALLLAGLGLLAALRRRA